MYVIRKGIEYFFPKIDKNLMEEAMNLLTEREKNIFLNMGKYDKFHCLEVYKKVKKSNLKDDKKYLRLALLHDCGKDKTGIFIRILHKIGFKTKLQNHAELGFKKIEKIDKELAILIKNHHNKNYSKEMDIFQKCDDES